MKIRLNSFHRPPTGFGMIIVLVALGIMLLIFASLLSFSSTTARMTVRNNLFNQAQNAAESSTENILAYMMNDFNQGVLNSANTYAVRFPSTNGWPIYFQFSDTNGNTANAATVWIGSYSTNATALNSQFAGLYGFVQPCVISSTATPLGKGQNLSATISQTIQFALIPLFQYAIFYNMDLEFAPGATMNINGRVHCNNTIWATGNSSSQLLNFSTTVEAATGIVYTRSTNDPTNDGRQGDVFFSVSNSYNPDPNANVLTLPVGATTLNNNPTNVIAILYPPPAAYALPDTGAAYFGPGTNYLENGVDLIVTNPAVGGLANNYGTNIIIYYQNPNNLSSLIPILPDVRTSTLYVTNPAPPHLIATNYYYANYSFVTNVSFYDYRESSTVQAVQINVAAFNTWLTNNINLPSNAVADITTGTNYVFPILAQIPSGMGGPFPTTNKSARLGGFQYDQQNIIGGTSKGHYINSIYVYNGVPLTGTTLPAVRMVSGQQLFTNGLSVITPQPMYVLGNYNTTTNYGVNSSFNLGDTKNTRPAGLFADAVTILSTNWLDANTSATLLALRTTVNTTVNAATLEGIVPSKIVPIPAGATSAYGYSGGIQNFLRLLEDWSGKTLSYNGSIVVMFPSQYATNYLQGFYYGIPTRSWGFDTNFNSASRLPPLTPQMRQTVRGTWGTQ